MTKARLTTSLVLAALYNHMSWSKMAHDRESLTYLQFKKIMMNDLDLIIDNGTCRQKWNDLSEFGYFTRIDDDRVTVELIKIRQKVGSMDFREASE